MTLFENVQKAMAIIVCSSQNIHSTFTQDGIITNAEVESSLQQAKNIVGWLEFLLKEK